MFGCLPVFGFFCCCAALVQARIFSPHYLNSFKVTCASRHTQRPYPCKKKVSVSSREEAESSPTQASEPTAPSAGTVTSPTCGDETSVHEVSSLDSPMHVNEGAEDKEEEVATEDPVVEQEEFCFSTSTDAVWAVCPGHH